MPKNKEIPVLEGFIEGNQLSVWCPHCRRCHIHGLGGQDTAVLHHRVAHCSSDSSPFLETGYYIKVVMAREIKKEATNGQVRMELPGPGKRG